MHKHIINISRNRDRSEVLASWKEIVNAIRMIPISFWGFRQITCTCSPSILGIPVNSFELFSKRFERGLIIADQDLILLLQLDLQIYDGIIDAYGIGDVNPLAQVECIDSSQWEITTSSEKISLELQKQITLNGW